MAERLSASLRTIARGRKIPMFVILANRRVPEAELLQIRGILVGGDLPAIDGDNPLYEAPGGFVTGVAPASSAPQGAMRR